MIWMILNKNLIKNHLESYLSLETQYLKFWSHHSIIGLYIHWLILRTLIKSFRSNNLIYSFSYNTYSVDIIKTFKTIQIETL